MKETLPVAQIETGMFVAELDRPWLGTPFLLQGFLVEDDQQLVRLRQWCREVTIDRSRSLAPHYAIEAREKPAPRVAAPRVPQAVITQQSTSIAEKDEFPQVYRALRQRPTLTGPSLRPPLTVPPVSGVDQQSRLEAELVYSAPIVDDVKRTLHSVRESVGKTIGSELKEVAGLVSEMAESVQRNPDAMIWLTRLRSSDEYSYDHALDVSVHLMVLARFLGMPVKTVELLGLVGLMQDVGKVNIPADILAKTEPLSAEELAQVQNHVASSMQMLLGNVEFTHEALNIVGSHHERFDGTGYPRRIEGGKISLNAELAGLIDTYCAMTRQRSYSSAVSSQKALEKLVGMRDNKFRAPLVDQLIQCVGLYPIGTLIELNSGEVGVVIQQNQVRRLKPRVMIVLAPDKTPERRPRTVDLMMDPPAPDGKPYKIVRSLPVDAYGIDPAEYYLG